MDAVGEKLTMHPEAAIIREDSTWQVLVTRDVVERMIDEELVKIRELTGESFDPPGTARRSRCSPRWR